MQQQRDSVQSAVGFEPAGISSNSSKVDSSKKTTDDEEQPLIQGQPGSKKFKTKLGEVDDKMPAGDYRFHVLIQKIAQLKPTYAHKDSMSVFFEVSSCGQSHQTETQEVSFQADSDGKSQEYIWNEHVYIEPPSISAKEIKQKEIVIDFKQNVPLSHNMLIGRFSFDVAKIYQGYEGHALENQWVAMNCPESDKYQDITAFLLVSVSVQGPTDKVISLEPSLNTVRKAGSTMIPISVSRIYKQFSITVLKIQNLPKMDWGLLEKDSINAFVEISQEGEKPLKSKVVDVKNGQLDALFNQKIQFGASWPTPRDEITMKILDADLTCNEHVGSILFSAQDLVNNYSNLEKIDYWVVAWQTSEKDHAKGQVFMQEIAAVEKLQELKSKKYCAALFDKDMIQRNKCGRLSDWGKLRQWALKANDPNRLYVWCNIYGSPPIKNKTENQFSHLMNEQPDTASDWVGRVLLHIEVEDNPYPKRRVIQLGETDKIITEQKRSNVEESTEFDIMAEIGGGICLPKTKNLKIPYRIGLKIQDNLYTTGKPKQTESGYCTWQVRLNGDKTKVEQEKKSKQPSSGGITIKTVAKNLKEIGDIFLYLIDPKGQQICYWRGPASQFAFDPLEYAANEGSHNLDPETEKRLKPKLKWYPLKRNLALCDDADKEYESGMIQFKLQIAQRPTYMHTRKTEIENPQDQFDRGIWDDFRWDKCPSWNKLPKRLDCHKVRCYIFACKDLPSIDTDGTADPYVRINGASEGEERTSIIHDSLNPIFWQVRDFYVEYKLAEEAAPIILSVWDSDADEQGLFTVNEDDFIGRAVITMDQIKKETEKQSRRYEDGLSAMEDIKKTVGDNWITQLRKNPNLLKYMFQNFPGRPRWYPLTNTFNSNGHTCGQILASFQIVQPDFKFQYRAREVDLRNILPQQKLTININALGLRNLKPTGLINVQKAFVRFNTKSMLPPDKAETIKSVSTEPKLTGPNPNINQSILIDIDLPVMKILCPKLSCDVFDQLCKGLSQPKIGTFTIDVGKIFYEQNMRMIRLLRKADDLIQWLDVELQDLNQEYEEFPIVKDHMQEYIDNMIRDMLGVRGSKDQMPELDDEQKKKLEKYQYYVDREAKYRASYDQKLKIQSEKSFEHRNSHQETWQRHSAKISENVSQSQYQFGDSLKVPMKIEIESQISEREDLDVVHEDINLNMDLGALVRPNQIKHSFLPSASNIQSSLNNIYESTNAFTGNLSNALGIGSNERRSEALFESEAQIETNVPEIRAKSPAFRNSVQLDFEDGILQRTSTNWQEKLHKQIDDDVDGNERKKFQLQEKDRREINKINQKIKELEAVRLPSMKDSYMRQIQDIKIDEMDKSLSNCSSHEDEFKCERPAGEVFSNSGKQLVEMLFDLVDRSFVYDNRNEVEKTQQKNKFQFQLMLSFKQSMFARCRRKRAEAQDSLIKIFKELKKVRNQQILQSRQKEEPEFKQLMDQCDLLQQDLIIEFNRKGSMMKRLDAIKLKDDQANFFKQLAEREQANKQDPQCKLKPIIASPCMTVIMGQFEYDQGFKAYIESVDEDIVMPKEMFKQVGWDSQDVIKEQESTFIDNQRRAPADHEINGPISQRQDKEYKAMILAKRNFHYRKIYPQELEKATMFTRLPAFQNIDIYRREEKSLTVSNIFGSHDDNHKVLDEDGNLTCPTKVKKVGQFKANIKIMNPKEEQYYKEQLKQKFDKLQDLIKDHYKKKTGNKFGMIGIDAKSDKINIDSQQDQEIFKGKLEEIMPYKDDIVDTVEMFRLYSALEFAWQAERNFVNVQTCSVRLYVLRITGISSMDSTNMFSSADSYKSDPYLIVKCGDAQFGSRDEHVDDATEISVNQMYGFSVDFPGAQPLRMELWDYDSIFGDDFIGSTEIDLDDRLYCQEWVNQMQKPIELRQLKNDTTEKSNGELECWLEIFNPEKAKREKPGATPQYKEAHKVPRIWDVSGEPKQKFQLRLAVMGVENVPADPNETFQDLFVSAHLEGFKHNKKETDTHWRSQTREGNFNWRLLFNFEGPKEDLEDDLNAYKLVVQCKERNLIDSNIGYATFELDLYNLVQYVKLTKQAVDLKKETWEGREGFKKKYGKDLQHKNISGDPIQAPDLQFEEGNEFITINASEYCQLPGIRKQDKDCKLRFALSLVTEEKAKDDPVGYGQQSPNMNPFLAPPEGRFEFSLNPFTMISQLFGKGYADMAQKYLCCGICCIFLFMIVPMIVTRVVGGSITNVLTGKK